MRHPTEGVLRRLIDEPAGVSVSDREHVAGCTVCLTDLATARDDAAAVSGALRSERGPEVDVPAAWRRLSTALPGPGHAQVPAPGPASAPARTARSRAFLRRPAAAALAVAVVLTGAGTAAANDWFQIFRTEQIATVGLSTADLVALPDLSGYGDLEVTGEGDMHEVADAAAAAAETGLEVPEVDSLPAGVVGEPTLQVTGQLTATFTFSAERASRTAAATGETLPPPPPGLDGSAVRLMAGPGLAQVWSSSSGVPALVVGRAVAPTAFSSGAPFETVRDYLLSLPGLPEDVAAQLRTFAADGSTLPLPVPADLVTTSSATVDGVEATVLATNDRTMAAVVWVDDSVVTVVAGTLDEDELLWIAQDLR